MARRLWFIAAMAIVSQNGLAQVGGGSVYRQGQPASSPDSEEKALRTVTKDDMPPGGSAYFDASVLFNVKADEYVALFGLNQEGSTPEECRLKMNGVIDRFSSSLRQLGVKAADIDVDFVAQNRIFGYDVDGGVAQEKVAGYELKKNVAIHYRDKAFLDKAISAANSLQIFDLIKLDYVVKDIDAVHTKLMEAAARVIRLKAANRARLLGVKLKPSLQVIAERYSNYYPSEMYSSYAAYEAENAYNSRYQGLTVVNMRKPRTFYFDPLDAKGYDQVLNPIVVEPVVQFTIYLKVRCETVPASKPAPLKPARR